MQIEVNVFEMIYLKRNLLLEESKTLIEYYNDKRRFHKFLINTMALIREDSGFFFLENNMKKVMTIISELRSIYKDDYDMINCIISEFNKFKNNFNKKEIVKEYFVREKKLRGNIFNKKSEIITSIIQDSVLASQILSNYLEVDIIYFVSSTSYFLKKYPIIYNEEEIKEITKTMLNTIKKTDSIKMNFLIKKLKKDLNK